MGNTSKINTARALGLIQHYQLRPVCDAWHYSWNLDYFYRKLKVHEEGDLLYVFGEKPIHEWAPAPLFSNDESLDKLIAQRGKAGQYWFLRLTDFHSFLARRSERGRHGSSRHFPSLRTYDKYRTRANSVIEQYSLAENGDLFVKWYDQLKDPRYQHTGQACIKTALKTNRRTPREWFKFYALRGRDNGDCYAVQLMIEDGRSCSGINLASVKDKHAYGKLLAVEVIKSLCERGYTSFDCGISESYGGYKNDIFLDVVSADNSGEMYFANGA